MSKNVNERKVPDTAVNRKFNATDAVMNMAIHTIKVCKNENIFIPEFHDVTEKIVETAVNAYIAADEANNILVKKGSRDYEKNVKDRLALEQLSIRYCSRLKSYITIAKRLFHLRNRKTKYWISLTVKARSYLKKWYEAEVERYK